MDLYHIFIGVAATVSTVALKRVQCGHISYTVPGSPGNGLVPTGYPDIRVMTPWKVMSDILREGHEWIFINFQFFLFNFKVINREHTEIKSAEGVTWCFSPLHAMTCLSMDSCRTRCAAQDFHRGTSIACLGAEISLYRIFLHKFIATKC